MNHGKLEISINIQDEIEKGMTGEIEKRLNQNCTHKFVDANDWTIKFA